MCKPRDILSDAANVVTFGASRQVEKKIKKGLEAEPVTVAAAAIAPPIEGQAAATANVDSLRRRRRQRASSLLATGGAGDQANPLLATPYAAPKATLGA